MVVLKPARLHAQQKKMGKKNNIVEPPIRGPKTMAIISPNSFETQKVGKPKQKIARKKLDAWNCHELLPWFPPSKKNNEVFWEDQSILLGFRRYLHHFAWGLPGLADTRHVGFGEVRGIAGGPVKWSGIAIAILWNFNKFWVRQRQDLESPNIPPKKRLYNAWFNCICWSNLFKIWFAVSKNLCLADLPFNPFQLSVQNQAATLRWSGVASHIAFSGMMKRWVV